MDKYIYLYAVHRRICIYILYTIYKQKIYRIIRSYTHRLSSVDAKRSVFRSPSARSCTTSISGDKYISLLEILETSPPPEKKITQNKCMKSWRRITLEIFVIFLRGREKRGKKKMRRKNWQTEKIKDRKMGKEEEKRERKRKRKRKRERDYHGEIGKHIVTYW